VPHVGNTAPCWQVATKSIACRPTPRLRSKLPLDQALDPRPNVAAASGQRHMAPARRRAVVSISLTVSNGPAETMRRTHASCRRVGVRTWSVRIEQRRISGPCPPPFQDWSIARWRGHLHWQSLSRRDMRGPCRARAGRATQHCRDSRQNPTGWVASGNSPKSIGNQCEASRRFLPKVNKYRLSAEYWSGGGRRFRCAEGFVPVELGWRCNTGRHSQPKPVRALRHDERGKRTTALALAAWRSTPPLALTCNEGDAEGWRIMRFCDLQQRLIGYIRSRVRTGELTGRKLSNITGMFSRSLQ
jgi:hypothetical protein